MNWITEVWTPASLLAAALGGLATGAMVISRAVLDPTFASGVASARAYGLLVGTLCVFLGAVFYGGQVLDTLLGPDTDLVERVTSRFGLWLVFSVATGLGVWIRVRDGVEPPT